MSSDRTTFSRLVGGDPDQKPMCQSCSRFSYRLERGICDDCWEDASYDDEYRDEGYQ